MKKIPFSRAAIEGIRTALLAFIDESGRDLPWRATTDPYAVWISEVMLQQTRVEAVIPYYERWLVRFPDAERLADASLDDVMKQWEGLGYYSRARNLHAAARIVREQYESGLPRSYDALRALPGVGDYTAGAVASIAFGAREPAVDGNARRVLARLLDTADPAPARLRAVAAALVPAQRPGDFNQALMELGSRVCTPRAPRCGICPVRSACRARRAGTQLARPQPRTKKTLPAIDVATVVARRRDGRVLVVRRAARGLLAGLWNFPGRELSHGDDGAAVARALLRELSGRQTSYELQPLGTIEHVFSHRRERYLCLLADMRDNLDVAAEHVWLSEDISGVALPRAQQRIHQLALKRALHPGSA